MKSTYLVLSIALLTVVSGSAAAQFSFGVSPGLTFNSASFGYKTGKVVTYIGFQHAGFTFTSAYSSKDYNYGTGQIETYTSETKVNARLLIPNLGFKFFFVNQGKLKAYGNLLVSKPILLGGYTYNGAPDPYFDETVGSINLWGGEAGFGVEYFLDAQFSIGGEYGFRPIIMNANTSDNRQVFNPNTGNVETVTNTSTNKATINPTYAKLALNFYFNKGNKEKKNKPSMEESPAE